MPLTSSQVLYNDKITLQELQTQTINNNEKLLQKKAIMDEQIKKIKELKLEQSRRQSQAALQNQSLLYDNKINEMEMALALQQEKIKEQIRINNHHPAASSGATLQKDGSLNYGAVHENLAQQNITELLEVLKQILKEKQNLLKNTTNMVKVLNIQYQQVKANQSRGNANFNDNSTSQYLAPILEKMNYNLKSEREKHALLEMILKKKQDLNNSLDLQIHELKRQQNNILMERNRQSANQNLIRNNSNLGGQTAAPAAVGNRSNLDRSGSENTHSPRNVHHFRSSSNEVRNQNLNTVKKEYQGSNSSGSDNNSLGNNKMASPSRNRKFNPSRVGEHFCGIF